MTILSSTYNRVSIPNYQSLPDFFFGETKKYGDLTAVIWPTDNKTYTFNQLKSLACQLTAGLQQLGVQQGDVIGTFLSNCPEFILLFLAAQRLGAIITTCNPAYTSEELLHQFNSSKVRYIFTEADFLDRINNVRNQMPELKDTIVIRARHVPYCRRFDDILAMGQGLKDASNLPTINAKDDVCFILYSSGTTGLPKGVMLTHFQMYCNIYLVLNMKGSEPVLKLSPNDIAIDVFPFFHAGGICLGILWTLLQGCPLVITPKYEPHLFLSTIQKYRITTLVLVPPVIVFLAKSPLVDEYDLSSLRNVLTAGAPMPPVAADEMIERVGIKHLMQMYGMTELAVVSHLQPISAKSKTKKGTVGVVVPNTRCKIVDPENFMSLGTGEIGEIWVESPTAMKGYLNNPKATHEMITSDGWLRTGDIGRNDQDGYFFIEDRLKELIKVRGFQVAPAELEALILTHSAVADVIVTSIPDTYSGELPHAYVVLRSGQNATEEDIREFVKHHVTGYKQLAGGVRFLTELPKTPSGKPLRRILKAKAREEMKSKL